MYSRTSRYVCLVVALAFAVWMPGSAAAQGAPNSYADRPSKWDIFLGYSYLSPHGDVNVLTSSTSTATTPIGWTSANWGMNESVARYFNKYMGWQVDSGQHALWTDDSSSNDGFFTIQTGPILRYPTGSFTPFLHALLGGARVGGPFHEPYNWGPTGTIGGGLDWETPLLNHHLAFRLFQGDYEFIHEDWGTGVDAGSANINAIRLSAGVVFHVGSIAPPEPVTISCAASPKSVFPGEPVTIQATAAALNPKYNAIYGWSGNGVSGTGATATVNTSALAPGPYTVHCDVKEGKPGKEGLKPWENADSSTTFTVKDFEPPTISCSTSPSTIKPGDSATVTASGVSPQNRPLTYSYSAASGTIAGSGTTATYSSTGAPTGPVAITCNVSDDRGHSATANSTVTIEAPPPPPQPHAQALCSITFEKDKMRPTRVDNEAKACLDEVALDLQKQSDAKVLVVGDSNAKEKARQEKEEKFAAGHKRAKVEQFAAQRAVNTKAYLATEKGIDPARIIVATGTADDQKVEDYLVPAGADFNADVTGTTPVDESTVKVEVRKPLAERHHKHHAAQN
jgi:hypothetical protein